MVVVWVEFDMTCRPFSTPYLTCLSNNEFCGFIRINQNSLRRLTYFSSVNEIDGSSTMIRPRTRQYMTMHTHTMAPKTNKSLLSLLPLGLCQVIYYQKSDNLKHIKMARWLAWTNDSSTKRLMFQAFFFSIISYRL